MPSILVVDDAAVDRRVIRGVLEQDPEFDIDVAIDAGQALKKLDERPWDLMITDMVMPGMDGSQLVQQTRFRFPRMPIIVVTSKGSELTAVEALKNGASSYVPKKAVAQRLAATVNELLAISTVEQVQERLMQCLVGTAERFMLENDSLLLDVLVVHLLDRMKQLNLCEQNERTSVGVALKEALKNALYHGNLELDSDLLDQGSFEYEAAADRNRNIAPYKDRRIHVDAKITHQDAVFRVRDEGPGFNCRNLPDPNDPSSLDGSCGRGIVLMRTFMDEVEYNDRGNVVTLTKHARSTAPVG
jgi:DNA-binding response OmpR family regulator